MTDKILITGATGFIGQHLVRALLEKNYNVRIFVRNEEKARKMFGDKVELVVGNLDDMLKIKDSLSNVRIVYHLAGKIGEWGIEREVYFKTNVEFTKSLINESINNEVKQFILCSSGGVLGPLKDEIIADETFPLAPSNLYEESKAEAEKYVLSQKEKINITIIRPEFVYGENDTHVLRLFKQINKGYFPLFGGGKSCLHPIYIQDVTNAFLLVLDNFKCYGEIFNVAGERVYTVKEYIESIEKILGKKCFKIYVPKIVGLNIAFIVEWISKLLNVNSPLTVSMVKFFTENRNCSSKKIQQFGLVLTPLEQGLLRTINYYKLNKDI